MNNPVCLKEHQEQVAQLAVHLFSNYLSPQKLKNMVVEYDLSTDSAKSYDTYQYDNLKEILYYSALFHDIGKLDPKFQAYLKKTNNKTQSKSSSVRHNLISWMIVRNLFIQGLLTQEHRFDNQSQEMIAYLVFWHHDKLLSEQELETYSQIYFSIEKNIQGIEKNVNEYLNLSKENVFQFIHPDHLNQTDICVPEFKKWLSRHYVDLNKNSLATQYNLTDKRIKKHLIEESILNLLRSVLITADRIVSLLEQMGKNTHDIIQFIKEGQLSRNLSKHLSNKDKDEVLETIEHILKKFKDKTRNQQQAEIVQKMASSKSKTQPKVVQGPAGCGKTKMMLEYLKCLNKLHVNKSINKVYLITPRNMVAESLFKELCSKQYFGGSNLDVAIKLYTAETGQQRVYKHNKEKIIQDENYSTQIRQIFGNLIQQKNDDNQTLEIIITNIDQISNLLKSHRYIDLLLDMLSQKTLLIFDEIHEFTALHNLMFITQELLVLKQLCQSDNHTLLVSATPNYFFTNQILGIPSDNIFNIETFNKRQFKLNLIEKDMSEDIQPLKGNEFFIFNTAIQSQEKTKWYINSLCKQEDNINNQYSDKAKAERLLNIHSKFTNTDKREIFHKLYDYLGMNHQTKGEHTSVMTGPIIQASLNISSKRLFTEISSPENLLQRIGRVNRFSEYQDEEAEINIYIKPNKRTNFILSKNCIKEQSHLFIQFLINKLDNQLSSTISLSELYDWYHEFSQSEQATSAYLEDYKHSFNATRMVFSKLAKTVAEPYKTNLTQTKDDKNIISVNNLRSSDSLFIKPITYNIKGDAVLEENGYLDEGISINQQTDLEFYTDKKMDEILRLSFEGLTYHYNNGNKKIVDLLHERPYSSILDLIKNQTIGKQKIKNNIAIVRLKTLIKQSGSALITSFGLKDKKNVDENLNFGYLSSHDVKIGLMRLTE